MTKLNSSFMIGNVEIPHRTVLAPMAGVTNSAFRTIAKEFGAGLVVMEMISEKGLLYNNEKTLHMLHIDENEHPMSIQLFGGDAEGLKRAADFIQTNTKADIVDINMGCPVNKVVKNEAGAKWLISNAPTMIMLKTTGGRDAGIASPFTRISRSL